MVGSKKIIFKTSEFPHLSETFIVAQIITAIKLGFDMKIIVSKLLNVQNSLYCDLLNEYKILDKIILEDYRVPKSKVIKIAKSIFLLILNLKKIKEIRSYYNQQEAFSLTWIFQWYFYEQFNSPDTIFHIQYGTNKNPLDLLKSAGFYKPSLVVTFHGHDAFFPINGFIPNDGYYERLFHSAELITANTPYLAEKILNLGCPKDKLDIIPVGVDQSFFFSKNKIYEKQCLKLITVGRLDPVKGHCYTVEAMKIIIAKGFDIKLTIVGEGAERTNLEHLIKQYQLEEYVFLTGRKSQEDIRHLLWEHDLYILTAVALPDGRRETQGLATLEAQSCGLPVIAFDSGGVKYTIKEGKTGFICEEYNIAEVVSKIELLYNDRDVLKRMSANTKDFINCKYSQLYIDSLWNDTYKKLIQLNS